jgi:hypothetical protein
MTLTLFPNPEKIFTNEGGLGVGVGGQGEEVYVDGQCEEVHFGNQSGRVLFAQEGALEVHVDR